MGEHLTYAEMCHFLETQVPFVYAMPDSEGA